MWGETDTSQIEYKFFGDGSKDMVWNIKTTFLRFEQGFKKKYRCEFSGSLFQLLSPPHAMLRIVEFALQLCSDNTERSSHLIRVTTARDICLEAFNELQNRVDLLQDQATFQTTDIIARKKKKRTIPKRLVFSAYTHIYSRE